LPGLDGLSLVGGGASRAALSLWLFEVDTLELSGGKVVDVGACAFVDEDEASGGDVDVGGGGASRAALKTSRRR
jgi:hypothetical protein